MNVGGQRTERNEQAAATLAPTSALSAVSPTPAAAGATLLPEPASPDLNDVQDAMSMMYQLVSKAGQDSLSTSEIGVDAQNRQEQSQAAVEQAALKKEEADEAKMNTGGSLFGSICHIFSNLGKDIEQGKLEDLPVDAVSGIVNTLDSPHLLAQLEALAPQVAEYVGIAAAVVGAGVLTAASGGAGGIAVAAVVVALSASGMFVAKTQCFGKDSAFIGLGLEVGSAVVSFGASAGMVASDTLQAASAVADGASGTADVLAGASTIVVGNEQADVTDDSADVEQATQAMNRNARLVADLVAGMKDAQESNKNSLEVLAGAARTYGQTLTLAAAMKA